MPIQRQSTLALTDENWGALNEAISTLMDNGTYAELAEIHTNPTHHMHGGNADPIGSQRFLPWHRAYLIVFERELRQIDDTLAIPYWDWNADGGLLEGFPDPADPRFAEAIWHRNPGTRQDEQPEQGRMRWFTDEAQIEAILAQRNYYQFAQSLEDGPHNAGHVWIGGDMNTMASPRDPAFWFHHAQVDRLWAQWQEAHRGQMANLAGADAQLDPWQDEFTVESVDNILGLGDDAYEYVEPIPTT